MRRNKIPIITLLALMVYGCQPLHISAQTSLTFSYPNLAVDKTVLCTDPGNGNDIVYYKGTSLGSFSFFYHNQGTGTSKQFIMPVPSGPTPNLQITRRDFNVNSMVVCGMYCYFCGVIHTYAISEVIDPEDAVGSRDEIIQWDGFLGRFPLAEIRNPSCTSLTMQYVTISGTKMLDRLESNDTLLAAIIQSTNDGYGFVVMNENGNNIDYLTLYPLDGNERVSDLVFNSNALIVVSSFTNDDNMFGIRDGRSGSLYSLFPTHGTPTFYNTIYKYGTANLSLVDYPSTPAPTVETTHDIRISSDISSEKVIVAYEATGEEFGDPCNSTVYNTNIYQCTISTSVSNPAIPAMINAMIVPLPSDYMNGLTDVRYIYPANKVALMYNNLNNATGVAGIIQYPKPDTPSQVECQYSRTSQLLSMDLYNPHNILFAGRGLIGNPLTHFLQDMNLASPSCMPIMPSCHSEEMSTPEEEKELSYIDSKYNTSSWSNPISLQQAELQCENTCSNY